MSRQEFSKTVRALALKRCSDEHGVPHCEGCGNPLTGAAEFDYDHDKPDGLGGEATLENCKVLCRKVCHVKKTTERDRPMMAKADRRRKKHFGIKSASRFPGSKDSGFKKKMNGEVVRR